MFDSCLFIEYNRSLWSRVTNKPIVIDNAVPKNNVNTSL